MDPLANNFAVLLDCEEEDAAKILERSAAGSKEEKWNRRHPLPSNYVMGETGHVNRLINYNGNGVRQINYGYRIGSGYYYTGQGSGQVYKINWQGNGNGYVYTKNWQGDGDRRVFSNDNRKQSYSRNKIIEIGSDELFDNEKVGDGNDGNEGQDAVSNPGNDDQGDVSVPTEVPSMEEVPSIKEVPSIEDEVPSKEEVSEGAEKSDKGWKKLKTLKEHEEELAKKSSSSVSSTKQRKVELDEDLKSMQVISKDKGVLYTKQKSKDNRPKKTTSRKDGKICKKMSIEEFQKLATKSKHRGGANGREAGANENHNKTVNLVGNGRGTGAYFDNYNKKMRHGGNSIGRNSGGYSKSYDVVNHDGNGRSAGAYSVHYKNKNACNGNGRGSGGYYKNNNGGNISYVGNGRGRESYSSNRNAEKEGSSALTVPVAAPRTAKVYDTVAAKVEPAPELNITNFPALGEATKPTQT